jgi:hypothetical protein
MKLKKPLLAALGLVLCLGLTNVRADEKADDRVNLLDGKDLTKNFTTKGNWILHKDGVVELKPRPGEKGWERYGSYLWAKGEYKDFEADFEYKVASGGNSGFYFHVGKPESPVATGVEVQIYASHGKKPGEKLTDHDSGGIIPGIPPTANPSKPAGEWNRMQVTCKGKMLTVRLNDVVVNKISLDNDKIKSRPKTGAIGFQDHGLPLSLRNIHIRELK